MRAQFDQVRWAEFGKGDNTLLRPCLFYHPFSTKDFSMDLISKDIRKESTFPLLDGFDPPPSEYSFHMV